MPQYSIVKKKIELGNTNPDDVVAKLTQKYSDQKINTDDGLRIDLEDHWVHFRKSNTEPIIRCIAEASTEEIAEKYIAKYFDEVKNLM
jgi:phosphomannomutase